MKGMEITVPDRKVIIDLCLTAGANVVGVASADSFIYAPAGFSPVDKLKTCRSVIVLGCPFPQDSLFKTTVEYTDIRNGMVTKLNEIAKDVAGQIKKYGYDVKIIGGLGGKWANGRFCGQISLKHAAELAGIGKITHNYLLTNPEHGNLLWFSAVLTSAEIEPDIPIEFNVCDNCNICVEVCPSGALDNKENFAHNDCRRTCYKTLKGKLELKCFECRKVCPYRFGIEKLC